MAVIVWVATVFNAAGIGIYTWQSTYVEGRLSKVVYLH